MSPESELANALEWHQEPGNAELARRIGGEVVMRDDVMMVASFPELGNGLNFASRLRLTPDKIELLVDEIVEWFTARQASPHIRVSPLTRPLNLASVLTQRGFKQTEAETQMQLLSQDLEPRTNPSVTVEQIGMDQLAGWVALQGRGFGNENLAGEKALALARATVEISGIRPYLAHLQDQVAGVGMLVAWANAFGIYGVATLPEWRGKGVGTVLLRRMIQDAQSRHARPICLQVVTLSETQCWYERLGFQPVYNRTGWTLENEKRAGQRGQWSTELN